MRKLWLGFMVALLLALPVLPALASPEVQEGGGVHFGAYTLQPGNRVRGDLVVIGGPVELGAGSELDGDLTVFGPFTMGTGAVLEGQLVVMGSADVSGRIEGDLFTAGSLVLRETATIEGDVAAAGTVDQAPGAVIEGEFAPIDRHDWDLPEGITVPGPFVWPRTIERTVEVNRTPRWVTYFWRLVKGIAGVVMLSLLALVIASLWPTHVERVGRVVAEAPLPAFGVGLLSLILAALAAAVLAITICLSPFALVGITIVGIGVLLGWIALGQVLGRKILGGAFNQAAPKAVTAAVVGTALISFILVLARAFGALNTFLLFLLVPPAAGAVVLTRFGTIPYATRGVSGSSSRPPGGPASRQPTPKPAAPAARPVAPLPQEVVAPGSAPSDRDEAILPQGDVDKASGLPADDASSADAAAETESERVLETA